MQGRLEAFIEKNKIEKLSEKELVEAINILDNLAYSEKNCDICGEKAISYYNGNLYEGHVAYLILTRK